MTFDPASAAKIEIESILKKYDVGGFVSVHSKDRTEFDFYAPSWSYAQFEERPEGRCLRIKYEASEGSAIQLEQTMHLIIDCARSCFGVARFLHEMAEGVVEKVEVTNVPFEERND